MTKRQYTKAKAELEAKLSKARADWQELADRADKGILPEADYAKFDPLNDLEDKLEKELRQLERDWLRRGWNTQDYAFAALVADNID